MTELTHTSVSEVFLNQLSVMRNSKEGSTRRAKQWRLDVVPGRNVWAPKDEGEPPAKTTEPAPEASPNVSDSRRREISLTTFIFKH